MFNVAQETRDKLMTFAQTLVDPQRAHILMKPHEDRDGFWFGSGNLVRHPDGTFYLVGRYRDVGDSRSGLGKGTRGVELAIFKSTDGGATFTKIVAFSKPDLDVGDRSVISIEGAKLHLTVAGVELFVSTEKSGIGYPAGLESFLKPGTGVWTIDRIYAKTVEELAGKRPETLIEGNDPQWLHVKDPVVFDAPEGDTLLYFCTHPFSWSSSNSAFAVRRRGQDSFSEPDYRFFPRGATWDVAMSRITGLCNLPRGLSDGKLSREGGERAALVFYDGGESMRNTEEHSSAVKRPRGYSCEEIGGLGLVVGSAYDAVNRLTRDLPAFVSPYGTGCIRYVDVLETESAYYATWQESQTDRSQPLMMNVVPREEALRILTA